MTETTTTPITSGRVQKALTLPDEQFKRLFGVPKGTFYRMLEILQTKWNKQRKRGGKQPQRLQVEDKLLRTLQYWREYRTMEHLAYEYDTVKSYIYSSMVWVENTLICDGTFSLPGKGALISGENTPRTILIDVAESPIERPKKTAKMLFRQEKTAYDQNTGDFRS